MSQQLDISFGQHSDRGRKAINQDSHGLAAPAGHLRRSKGIAAAVADGIGSSGVSHVASAAAVQSFLSDYFSTP
ncbi:protein phosphatase 2C domain-containing protein, partial [Acinetobacter baumannii]